MANQLKMVDIQAVLTLHGLGWSNRRIAQELSLDRETVGRHVRLALAAAANPAGASPGSECPAQGAQGSNPASAPSGSEGAMEGVAVSKPASAPSGAGAEISSSQSAAWPWREIILEMLQQGLQARRIYQDLLGSEHGYGGSYYSVRRLVKKLTAWTQPLSSPI